MEFEKLCSIIAEVMDVDPGGLTGDTAFVEDLGADSLDVFQIIMGIEEKFDIELDAGSVEQITTIGGAVEKIKKAMS